MYVSDGKRGLVMSLFAKCYVRDDDRQTDEQHMNSRTLQCNFNVRLIAIIDYI